MKRLLLGSLIVFGLALGSTGHSLAVSTVNLSIDTTAGLPSETINSVSGLTFTLDINVEDTSGTQALGGFDLTLSALPNGLTFDGYSNPNTNFTKNPQTSGLYYSANDLSGNITIGSSETTLLQATFTATASGVYDIDFIAPAAHQELSDGSGNSFGYNDVPNTATATVAPEPAVTSLLLVGAAAFFGLGFRRRASV
jgi:hypothetical protein